MNETSPRSNARATMVVIALMVAVIVIPFVLQSTRHAAKPASVAPSASGKIVMMDFYTDWCGWCKKMDEDVYPQADVKKAMEPFEFRRVNAEQGPENQALAKKYHVDGFPTIVFVDSAGNEVDRIVGYEPADKFAEHLRSIAAKCST